MEIVQADLQHVKIVASLFDAYRQFYRRPANLAGAQQFIADRLTKGDSIIFLALDGETTLGFTQLYPAFSSLSMGAKWLLNDLFVAPEARRRGVGEGLLTHAADFARASGSKGLSLATEITNITAQRLYERLGWQREIDFYHYDLSV